MPKYIVNFVAYTSVEVDVEDENEAETAATEKLTNDPDEAHWEFDFSEMATDD